MNITSGDTKDGWTLSPVPIHGPAPFIGPIFKKPFSLVNFIESHGEAKVKEYGESVALLSQSDLKGQTTRLPFRTKLPRLILDFSKNTTTEAKQLSSYLKLDDWVSLFAAQSLKKEKEILWEQISAEEVIYICLIATKSSVGSVNIDRRVPWDRAVRNMAWIHEAWSCPQTMQLVGEVFDRNLISELICMYGRFRKHIDRFFAMCPRPKLQMEK